MGCQRHRRLVAGWLALALLLGGCGSTVDIAGMVVGSASAEKADTSSQYYGRIRVAKIIKARANFPVGYPKFTKEVFEAALRQSLAARGFLAVEGGAAFVLETEIVNVVYPPQLLRGVAHVTIRYRLMESGGGIVLDEVVNTTHRTDREENSSGMALKRRAAEHAARDNITILLGRLGG